MTKEPKERQHPEPDRHPTRDRDWGRQKDWTEQDGRRIQESTDYFKPPKPKENE
jgi:hypothetical protein